MDEDIEALVTIDTKGIIISASANFWTLLGYTSDELQGKSIYSVLDEGFSMSTLKARDLSSQIMKARHKDGTAFFVHLEMNESEYQGKMVYRGMIRRLHKKRRAGVDTKENLKEGEIVEGYVVEKTLGSGYFGEVKKAIHSKTSIPVAIKTLKKAQYEEAKMKYPPREIKVCKIRS